ncbi:MAG: hypothetical protein KME17_14615 [Cyanosarcina radialis HA8281-LM2]|nr:hypothetical protein [Cyanosarcina radialis HA8281-LM2]
MISPDADATHTARAARCSLGGKARGRGVALLHLCRWFFHVIFPTKIQHLSVDRRGET